ncbi:MAG: radical SAM protein [Candidatus Stahlbacteria bacterium]|nr:radical SAM protein [Candidatus Stahlbacteria bacterium]
MQIKEKLKLLGSDAKYDVCGYPRMLVTHKQAQQFSFVYHATGEGGKGLTSRCTRLFKVLQTNKCEHNCYYCVNRRERNYPRLSFTPKELSDLFMEHYTNGLVEGCFLSSAIYKNADYSQEEIIQTLQLLRQKHNYKGYIHTKILPDTSDDLIYESAKYSDRLSINLEAPGQDWLSRLSPSKNYAKLIAMLRKIVGVARDKKIHNGVTTQLIVGGAGETDRAIVNLATKLYYELKLRRVYYSGFIPVAETPFQNTPLCPPEREYRLYQADSLIRKYGFKADEIPYDANGFLPTDDDPKLVWAKQHPESFPIEVNTASFHQLIRVPGIGRISAQKIVCARKEGRITTIESLKKMGIIGSRARNYILINSRMPKITPNPKETAQKQMFLWEEI